MVVGGFILSILAILIALGSAVYARQQAQAAKATVHMQDQPDLQLSVERSVSDMNAADLLVTHRKGPDLDRVDVRSSFLRSVPVTWWSTGLSRRVCRSRRSSLARHAERTRSTACVRARRRSYE
jgi:hypothetical protein